MEQKTGVYMFFKCILDNIWKRNKHEKIAREIITAAVKKNSNEKMKMFTSFGRVTFNTWSLSLYSFRRFLPFPIS